MLRHMNGWDCDNEDAHVVLHIHNQLLADLRKEQSEADMANQVRNSKTFNDKRNHLRP